MKNYESIHIVIHSSGLQKFMIREISELDVVPLCLVVVDADISRQSPSKTHDYDRFSKALVTCRPREWEGGLGTLPACGGRQKSVHWSQSSYRVPAQMWGRPSYTWKSTMQHYLKVLTPLGMSKELGLWCEAALKEKDMNVGKKGEAPLLYCQTRWKDWTTVLWS